jgi:cysteine synthase A
MKTIYEMIGNTPLVRFLSPQRRYIFAKAEFLNPGGSIKDRVALSMIEDAEKSGVLKPDSIIAEATSGNTGIGIALVGRIKGYRVIIVMPENMSEERKKIIRALGAELILTPAEKSIQGAVDYLNGLKSSDERIWVAGQFTNPSNPLCHYNHTAREIWAQTGGKVDAFVAGVGSGGTLQGVGKFLKEKNKRVKIVAVEPANASALLGHEPGLHQIQGIGDGFIPAVLDTKIIDEVITVTDEEAIETTRMLAREEGLLVGTSSGANVFAATRISRGYGEGFSVVTVLPDRAERYFSTALI